MNISIDWLRDYVDVGVSVEELAERLTMAGLEVEEIERIGSEYEGVLVGRVLEVSRHPYADRLSICRVDVGADDNLSIVCGAPNVEAGQNVPVATVGSILTFPPRSEGEEPQTLTIKRAKLRGEVSEGMICSESELGLSDNHDGIMVLTTDAEPGKPFREYLAEQGVTSSDSVLDIAITPNRPDATSHFGVARDVAALTGAEFNRPDVDVPPTTEDRFEGVSIEIEAPELCRRYVGLVVRGVSIEESPDWLKQRLTAIGLRPRNNVVDVTNYVMFECGQPLHAFDLGRLAGPAIRVRKSEGGERFVTLDEKEHELPEGSLLICDAEKPVALAGIMGGLNSEVSDETTDILIESAYFDPTSVRRTAKSLSIQTDSSYRFERGVDSNGQLWAAARAAQLIAQIAGGQIGSKVIDIHPSPVERKVIRVRPERVNRLLGTSIRRDEMVELLMSIGFIVEDSADSGLDCTVPTYRPDVEREVDVIEEVARLYGYENIPMPAQSTIPNVVPARQISDVLKTRVRDRIAGLGYHELHTNSMLRVEAAARFASPPLVPDDAKTIVETLNPISREMAALRPSLLPGVLQVISHNQNHGQKRLSFFEFGHVFLRGDSESNVLPGYRERDHLLVVTAGTVVPNRWLSDERQADIFDLKGVAELLAEFLNVTDIEFIPEYVAGDLTTFHLEIKREGARVGILGKLSQDVSSSYDIDSDVFFLELDWEVLARSADTDRSYSSISRFPVVERDLAIVADRARAASDIEALIRQYGGALLKDVILFDLFEGNRLPDGKRSLAYTLRFGANRTLKDNEVDEQIEAITLRLKEEYGAELRH